MADEAYPSVLASTRTRTAVVEANSPVRPDQARRSVRLSEDAAVERGEPIRRDLESRRGLSDDERRLLFVLTAAAVEPLLDRQVDTAAVVAVCRCGCSSVQLRSDEPPVPEARVVKLSGADRPDYFSVTASGGSARVTLHVMHGRLVELEIFAGEGVTVSLSDLTDLDDVTVG